MHKFVNDFRRNSVPMKTANLLAMLSLVSALCALFASMYAYVFGINIFDAQRVQFIVVPVFLTFGFGAVALIVCLTIRVTHKLESP